jgi:small subunit ribosomal protein S16
MLVIRLARTGRSKYPTYRIVAADSARAATGRFVAQLGHYNPHTKELVVKRDEVEKYLSTGAQPSNTVIKLLQRDGVKLPDWAKLKTKAPKPKEEVAKEEAPAEEERVATQAEDAAVAIEEEASSVDDVETAATEEAAAEKAEAGEADAAEAAIDEAPAA